MRTIQFAVLFFSIMVLSISCVSHKASYSGEWNRIPTTDNPYFTLYLIGDAGNTTLEQGNLVFEHLKSELTSESSSSAVVWLGDNIYPVGLAPSGSIYYKEGRSKLLAQLNTMSEFKGYKFFVPGNHDWYTFGRVGLRRQELLVDSFLIDTPNPNHQNNFFLPDKGCGDPKAHVLKDGISLLTMDSNWFLNDKTREQDLSVCEVKTTQDFLDKLKSEIESQNDNTLIVASHHPPYTYSRHGGYYSVKDHIFPLTQRFKRLYVPIPILGFIFNKMRTRVTSQDVYHPRYISYRYELIKNLKSKGSSIIASGHEHTLQLIQLHNQHFVVSGSGTKKNKVRLADGSKFAIGEKGYVKVVFHDSKNAVIQFIVPGFYEEYGNIAYEELLKLD